MLGGADMLAWLVLALGAAMALGSALALARPRTTRVEGELDRPPLARSAVMIGVGLVATVWAVVSLVAG